MVTGISLGGGLAQFIALDLAMTFKDKVNPLKSPLLALRYPPIPSSALTIDTAVMVFIVSLHYLHHQLFSHYQPKAQPMVYRCGPRVTINRLTA